MGVIYTLPERLTEVVSPHQRHVLEGMVFSHPEFALTIAELDAEIEDAENLAISVFSAYSLAKQELSVRERIASMTAEYGFAVIVRERCDTYPTTAFTVGLAKTHGKELLCSHDYIPYTSLRQMLVIAAEALIEGEGELDPTALPYVTRMDVVPLNRLPKEAFKWVYDYSDVQPEQRLLVLRLTDAGGKFPGEDDYDTALEQYIPYCGH